MNGTGQASLEALIMVGILLGLVGSTTLSLTALTDRVFPYLTESELKTESLACAKIVNSLSSNGIESLSFDFVSCKGADKKVSSTTGNGWNKTIAREISSHRSGKKDRMSVKLYDHYG